MPVPSHARSIHGDLSDFEPDSDLVPMLAVEVQESDPLPLMWRKASFKVQLGLAVLPALTNKGEKTC